MADKVAKNAILNPSATAGSTLNETRCNTLNNISLFQYVAGKLEVCLHEIPRNQKRRIHMTTFHRPSKKVRRHPKEFPDRTHANYSQPSNE